MKLCNYYPYSGCKTMELRRSSVISIMKFFLMSKMDYSWMLWIDVLIFWRAWFISVSSNSCIIWH